MLISFLRTVVLYLLLIVTVRLMGKRQIGEMEPAEFVVTMLLANLAAIPMQDSAIPLLSGLVPILVILGLELILAAVSLRSIRMRRLLCGKPVILMQNGKILERNLQRTRVNLDELTMHLREKGIFDLSTVKFAILETNGQLSTLLYAKEQPASARDAGIRVRETELPVTIISAGRILAENLHLAGRDGGWLEAELKRRSLTAEQVLLLTVDAAGTVYLVRKEDLAGSCAGLAAVFWPCCWRCRSCAACSRSAAHGTPPPHSSRPSRRWTGTRRRRPWRQARRPGSTGSAIAAISAPC